MLVVEVIPARGLRDGPLATELATLQRLLLL
jgi:hypothetical protein